MQTLLIWLILVESAIKMEHLQMIKIFDKRHIYAEPTMWSFLHFPSCSITCWKYTFLQYTNFVASSNCNYFQLQLTNSNWVGPLSLAQLCPSLFSNLHVKLELFTKFLQNFIIQFLYNLLNNPEALAFFSILHRWKII